MHIFVNHFHIDYLTDMILKLGLLLVFFVSSPLFPPQFISFHSSLLNNFLALLQSLTLHSSGLCTEAAVIQSRRKAALRGQCG